MKELLLAAAFLVSVAWLVLRIRRGNKEVEAARAPRSRALYETSPFHAVSVKYSSTACDAAKAMTGRRFLASAAPKLPLPGCDASDCRCSFAHHKDRRSGSDRRSPFSPGALVSGTGTHRAERRDRRDRRRPTDAISF